MILIGFILYDIDRIYNDICFVNININIIMTILMIYRIHIYFIIYIMIYYDICFIVKEKLNVLMEWKQLVNISIPVTI